MQHRSCPKNTTQIPRAAFNKAKQHLLKEIEADKDRSGSIPCDLSMGANQIYVPMGVPRHLIPYFFEQMANQGLVAPNPLGGWMRPKATTQTKEELIEEIKKEANRILGE